MLAALFLFPAAVQAATCSRAIRVPLAPLGRLVMVSESGQLEGVWPEFLRLVGEATGCRFELSSMPRARMEMELQGGQLLDLMISATRTEERDARGLFLPLYNQPLVILTRSSDADRITTVEALRRSSWRMASPRSFAFSTDYRNLVDELQAEKRVDMVNDTDAVGRMLRASRVDFALLSPPQAHAAADPGLSFRRLEGMPTMIVGLYLSRANLPPADLALLRRAFTKAARDGLVRRAFLRHYPPEVADLNQPRSDLDAR